MTIDEVKVISDGNTFSEDELKYYVSLVKSKHSKEIIVYLEVTLADDGRVNLHYEKRGEKFERIRRITGYLVGTIDRWNDAKRAEERERVKHNG